MSFMFRILAIFFATFLFGCAEHMPPLNFSVPNVGVSQKKLDAEVRSLTVSMGRPDELTGPLEYIMAESAGTQLGTGGEFTNIWKNSIQEALDRMVIFRDDVNQKISISVKILKIDTPSAGAEMTTNIDAKYEIIDRSNGDIIYSRNIQSTGVVPFSYALLGFIRARESVNRAVQNNITTFLQDLEGINLKTPMFPASPSSPATQKVPTT